jgi:peptide/nickel transport system permease protein
MVKLCKHVVRLLIVVLVGGLMGGTLVRLAPGFGVDERELDTRLNRASIENIRHERSSRLGLVPFYIHYLGRLLHGDLGTSQSLQQPVRRLLADRYPETMKSLLAGLALGWSLGTALAIATVVARSWCVDVITSMLISVLLCLPAAVLALLFVMAGAPGRLVIGLVIFTKVFVYARNLLERASSMPHVLTARAKGQNPLRIMTSHILPVIAPQLLALAGVTVSVAFAAAIPVEVICDLPGIGQLAWKAAIGRDLPLLVTLTLIVTSVTLMANAAADFLGLRERTAVQ